MRKWLKRIRGALGMGLTWAAAWFGVGAVIGVIIGFPWYAPGIGSVVAYGGIFAALGFGAGTVFSIVLGIAEGRRRFDEMSLPRFAGWGAAGGLLVSLFFEMSTGGSNVMVGSVITLLGAGSAAGSLALARRADDRELLDAGADVGDIGLTEEEKRELLTG